MTSTDESTHDLGHDRSQDPTLATDAARAEGGRVSELDESECWDLLRLQPVGRLAWNGAAGPTVIPVNYALAEGGLDIRTAAYSAAVREADDSPISFQADHLDPLTRTGWSVLVHARASIDWSHESAGAPAVDVWPGGSKPLRLHLEVVEISGRRLSA